MAREERAHRPFYRDPLSLLGWGIALASIVAYWYFFVRRPAPKPGQQVARLTAVEGDVKVKPNAREAWQHAQLADLLHVGDVLQTETRAGAQIQFNAGSLVTVRSDSVVYIGGSAESSSAAWRVQSGRVNFSVGGEEMQILTPTVRTTATHDASGNIDVGVLGDTGVKIFRGQAEIETTRGERITLGENQAVQVDAAGKAGARVDLPPAPTLIAPAAKSRLPRATPPEPSARLSWSAVRGAATYHVALDYNVVQSDLLLSAALDEPGVSGTTHDLEGLDVGRYFWRVAAVNADGLEGAFSRVSFFSVVEPAPPPAAPTPTPGDAPTLVLEALEEVAPGILHVGGRTTPGSTVTVSGVPLRVMPDGSFSEHVRRPGGGGLVVRATGRDGRVIEESRVVSER